MQRILIVALANAFLLSTGWAADQRFDQLARRVPFLLERLHSNRWEVRYCLLRDLTGRDEETKQVLESLVRDENKAVANQALVHYLIQFVNIDKALFKPEIYEPNLPPEYPHKALVDYCLGRRKDGPRGTGMGRVGDGPPLSVLDPTAVDEPEMYESLTIVGILGSAGDAKALYPFLQSTNDYVVLGAAKALIRLGDKEKATAALARLTENEPVKHLYYITEALYVLKEIKHPEIKGMVRRVLAKVDRAEGVAPNWSIDFLFLAADIAGKDVWDRRETQK